MLAKQDMQDMHKASSRVAVSKHTCTAHPVSYLLVDRSTKRDRPPLNHITGGVLVEIHS